MLTLRAERKCFGGALRFYSHPSKVCQGPMNFSLFLPSMAQTKVCPVVYFLSGLTCNDENFMMKAGAQRVAEKLGLILVAPDTSPRKRGIEGETGDFSLGEGAGFYLNAIKEPWAPSYQMYDYVALELPALIKTHFSTGPKSIMGHSMGGLGALVIGLRNAQQFISISALAPICAPMDAPWGQKAFSAYLGDNKELWSLYDPLSLLAKYGLNAPILVDQGNSDEFLIKELRLSDLEALVLKDKLPIEIRRHDGYDHSYYFVASFIEDHLRFHWERGLKK